MASSQDRDTSDKALGNTKTSASSAGGAKRQQVRRWTWTAFLESHPTAEEIDGLCKTLNENCTKWVFQVEKAKSGKLHYQGYSEFKTAREMGGVKAMLHPHAKAAHLEKAKGTAEMNHKYCTKDESRVEVGGEGGDWPKVRK